MKSIKLFIMFLLLSFAFNSILFAAYLRNQPITDKQPDGTVLNLYASGDEFYNWVHDKEGYTIMLNDKGWYVYAMQKGSDITQSSAIVGKDNPAASGIKPLVNKSPEEIGRIRRSGYQRTNSNGIGNAPHTGAINNIVIFIRFSDQTEYTHPISTYSSMFNGSTGNTMQAYFNEASYNQLNVTSTFYPIPGTIVVSWQDSHPRNYYRPYNVTTNTIGYQEADVMSREHTLLVNAVTAVRSAIPTTLNIDGDNDGNVDNVCFVIQGNTDGWNDLLWPHRWVLYSQTVTINTKRVYDYNFQLSGSMATEGVGVLCHEMFHSIGAPDLYHYIDDGNEPVGYWDIMEGNTNPPQHMSAYMKFKYGLWISSIPVINAAGTYSLNSLVNSTNNCYRINTANSTTEYYVLEYRKKTGTFENSLPGSGLIVYRINSAVVGNDDGPPDEVYAYRVNGTMTDNGDVDQANFSTEVGRTTFNSNTNPNPFLSTGTMGDITLSSIGSSSGNSITFNYGSQIPQVPIIENFESGFTSLPWTFSGNANWTIDTVQHYNGIKSAKSGVITHSQETTMQVNVTSITGQVNFYYKVSSENDFDFLYFYVDGVIKSEWSGEVNWSFATFDITAGNHVLKWVYSKDESESVGSDCAWVDYIGLSSNSTGFNPPTNFNAVAGNTSAILTWNAPISGTPSGYKVFRNSTLVTTLASTVMTYTNTGLTNGTPYEFWMTATYTNPVGESPATAHITVTPSVPSLNPPTNLVATQTAASTVTLTWQLPGTTTGGITEGFEGTFPAAGWTQTITDNSTNTYGVLPTWCQVGAISSISATPHGGVKQVGLWWSMNHQDEWLITPQFVCPSAGNLTFWSYCTQGSTKLDHYYVKVSTNNGSSWTVLWDASTLPQLENHYTTPYTISLSAYAGQNIKLAWQGIDGPSMDGIWNYWFLDDITVSGSRNVIRFNSDDFTVRSETSPLTVKPVSMGTIQNQTRSGNVLPLAPLPSRSLTGVKVYRNNTLIQTIANATAVQYVDTGVLPGTYIYKVSCYYTNPTGESVYSNESSVTIPGTSFNPPTNFNAVAGNASAILTWSAPMSGTPSGYKVFRNSTLVTTLASTVMTYTNTGLTNGTPYEFWMTATYTNPVGESSATTHITVTPSVPTLNPPTNLVATLTAASTVTLTWQLPSTTPGGITEGFEGTFPATGWTQTITDHSTNTYGVLPTWCQVGTINTDPVAMPHGGVKQVGLWWSMNHQDEWLITPQFVCPSAGNLTFWSYCFQGSTNLDHYYVKVSTNNGSSWTVLWDASTLPELENPYTTPYTISLSAYAGQNIKLAWQGIDGPNMDGLWYYWFLDDITVSGSRNVIHFNSDDFTVRSESSPMTVKPISIGTIQNQTRNGNVLPLAPLPSRSLTGVKVYRNNTLLQTIANATAVQYVDTGVLPGTYIYKVSCYYTNPTGESAYSNESSVTIPVTTFNPPTNFHAVAGNASAALTWSAPTSGTPTNYKVYRNNTLVTTLASTVMSYTNTGLTNGIAYEFWITAVYSNPTGESPATTHITVTPVAPTFNPPTNLVAIQTAWNAVTLTWQLPARSKSSSNNGNSLTREGYTQLKTNQSDRSLAAVKVYRNGSLLHTIPNATTTQYIDTSVVPGTYIYKVTCYYTNPIGESPYSNEATVIIPAYVFNPPTNFNALAGHELATLTWAAPTSGTPTGYKVYRNNTLLTTLAASVLTYTNTGLSYSTTYEYWVTATYSNPTGESAATAHITVILETPPMNPPTNLSAVQTAWNVVTLTWQLPEEIIPGAVKRYEGLFRDRSLAGVKIYRNSSLLETIANITAVQFADSSVVPGTYLYQVTCFYTNPVGESAFSNDASITIPPYEFNPPTNFAAVAGNASATLTWAAPVSGTQTGYKIYRNNELAATFDSTVTTYQSTDLINGTPYEFWITATYTHPTGESAGTEHITVTPLAPLLNPPTNLTGSIMTGNSVHLAWDAPVIEEHVVSNKDAEYPNRSLLGYRIYQNNISIQDVMNPQTLVYDVMDIVNGSYSYKVTALYTEGESDPSNTISVVGNQDPMMPILTALHGNYPNPFNPTTVISYSIRKTDYVSIEIYNALGQKVKTLVNSRIEAGNHTTTWNGNAEKGVPLSSGIYFYQMKAGNYSYLKKMVLLK